jgi:bla regulator protein BlaR1
MGFIGVRVAGLVLCSVGWVLYQQTAPSAFEVASIRPAAPNTHGDSIRMLPGGGLNASNITLRKLIGFAYGVRESEIFGGPVWTGSEQYDISAKPGHEEGSARGDQESVRQRVRALLVDRFHLSIHRETRELPVFALMVAKGGHRLRASKAGDDDNSTLSQRAAGEIFAQRVPMQTLASTLTEILGRPVRDKTGLAGTFDFTVRWDPRATVPTAPEAPLDLTGPSIFTAIQEQLGLRLDSQRGPAETIVIDRAEKPSEN